ncbi:MAG: tetratricopeptide repeat protein [Acidobacteria bacterium]|nr:tetratricopeptide repeat protein [Acidobacteriota bacterium]
MVAADNKAKFLQDAERYVLHGKVQQAIGEYLKIIKVDPKDVLTLNTIGDLLLRQGNVAEANRYFTQVAEDYVRNNFFLKAIAVYRKILSADPGNLEINRTMAALYAKQGLSVDARNQYLKVASLLEKEGRAKEILDVYEKIVELDPTNSDIQKKLAELHLGAGSQKQAYAHFAGAARAQMKARDLAGAVASFERAMQIEPLDTDAMGGFLECCQELGDISPALDRLKRSLEIAPQNLGIREMLGQAYLAANDPEEAAKVFQVVISMDESRYEGFFAVTQSLIDKEKYDQAIGCLETIIPILITRRETERAALLYEQILDRCPGNILPQVKLASIYSATGDHTRYLDALDKIADHYLEQNRPIEAIEFLEKILQAVPQSEKHRELHRKAFAEAYPDVEYVAPSEPSEPAISTAPVRAESDSAPAPTSPEIVEVDLLLNYGLKEKALSILRSLETRDPNDKEVRIRLLSIYKAGDKHSEAAEQCLLLAALYRMSKNEEAAQDYLDEAKQLAPHMAEYEQDLEEFARTRGIAAETVSSKGAESGLLKATAEVDLSTDLMDIFFVGDQGTQNDDDSEIPQIPEVSADALTESYPQNIAQTPPKSIQEQLQEVDFYIRLGFNDEALAKLNDIAKTNPGHPELESRYAKLGQIMPEFPEVSEAAAVPDSANSRKTSPSDTIEILPDFEVAEASSAFAIVDSGPMQDIGTSDHTPAAPAPPAKSFGAKSSAAPKVQTMIPLESDTSGFQANEMFADLMDDVGPDTTQEDPVESFENHYSLGTAYREMDLLDDAIKEFESALKAANARNDSQRVIQCCGMLSACFLKRDMPSSALRWCQTGLSFADISSHEAMALRYDMGVAHSMSGSSERALECFDRIFGMDPGYRDVAQRIDKIKSGLNRHAP